MSAWADLAGDDSNLSMGAEEFVGLNVLNDISNSASQNRSRFDPELDNSKSGLNRQLKMFGLGSNSNSGLSKKRKRNDLPSDEQDMPPKSKQRTIGPSDFSRFLDASPTSAPDLSSLESSSCNTSATNASMSSTLTPQSKPISNDNCGGLYAAIIGSKGKSSSKKASQSISSSVGLPSLTSASTSVSTTEPTPTSCKTVKCTSIPSSVRRRRLMRRRALKKKKSSSSPTKSEREIEAETNDSKNENEDEGNDDACEEPCGQDKENECENKRPQFQPMDEDGDDTREAKANGQKLIRTDGDGMIFLPEDIVQNAERAAAKGPLPSPFRLMRSKSKTGSESASPTKLSFDTAENSPPAFNPNTSPMPTTPFNLFNFMPLPIQASSFGLTSTSVSNAGTPKNENAMDEDSPEPGAAVLPTTLPPTNIFPFASSFGAVQQPSPTDGMQPIVLGTPPFPNGVQPGLVSPTTFNFPLVVPMPVAMPSTLPNTTAPIANPPAFVPFQPMVFQPVVTTVNAPLQQQQSSPLPTAEKTETKSEEKDVVMDEAPKPVPPNSVWAAPVEEDESAENSWRTKCFKREVARNKILKAEEERQMVEKRKLEMQHKKREKELLPIEKEVPVRVNYMGSFGTNKKSNRKKSASFDREDGFNGNRRMRGRARTRSLSQGIDSPPRNHGKRMAKKSESTSESGTSTSSPSRNTSVSVESRELPFQEPQPVTAEKIAWREKMIQMGKNTTGYQNYVARFPKAHRSRKHPQTPNAKENISKRRWQGKYNKWRAALHEFDDEEETEGCANTGVAGSKIESEEGSPAAQPQIESEDAPPSSIGEGQ